jgi:5-methylcytosine-specific restriction endonuclease McrA
MNPGEELRDYIAEMYPVGKASTAEKMDFDLGADGELLSLFHSGLINYLVRRLVVTAEYHRRTYDSEWKTRLRKYLRDYTRFHDKHHTPLLELLSRCLSAKDETITGTEKNRIKKEARANGDGCYVCGRAMDYLVANQPNSYTMDHIWPSALGGSSEGENLKGACQICNTSVKRDFLDASDYHFEEISLVSGTDLWNEFSGRARHYRGAVFFQTDFKCAYCGQPAVRVGDLKVGRREDDDSWHFLNLAPYCPNHFPA